MKQIKKTDEYSEPLTFLTYQEDFFFVPIIWGLVVQSGIMKEKGNGKNRKLKPIRLTFIAQGQEL